MNLLITGASGYLGGCFVNFFNNNFKDYNLFLTTRDSKNIPNFNKNKIIELDWDDDLQLQNALKNIDVVIHTAGLNSKDANKSLYDAINFNSFCTHKLLKYSIKNEVKKFIYLSTYHVYSNDLNSLYSENSFLAGTNNYSLSKIIGELSIKAALDQKLIEGCILRISNGFGVPGNNNLECWNLFVNQICKQAIIENKIEIKSDFNLQRNFIPVSQICLIVSLLVIKNINEVIFNVGSNNNYSLLDMAKLIKKRYEKLYNKELKINLVDKFILEPLNNDFFLSVNRINQCLSLPLINFELEIDMLLKYCFSKFK